MINIFCCISNINEAEPRQGKDRGLRVLLQPRKAPTPGRKELYLLSGEGNEQAGLTFRPPQWMRPFRWSPGGVTVQTEQGS